MTEPEPEYPTTSATWPDAKLVPQNGMMPEYFKRYLMQRRRALITEKKAIEKMLGLKS